MKNRSPGFTLIELVVVIVILGILAVTAAPKFLNLQRDAHISRAEGSFAAFTNAVQLYHSKWMTSGEPDSSKPLNGYGNNDIYPSNTGFPLAVAHLPKDDGSAITGEDCAKLWGSLLDTDLKARDHGSSVFPSDEEIVSWYTQDGYCYYYYTSGFTTGEAIPRLNYSPFTGETRLVYSTPSG